jgi:hypothetical protein
MKERIKITTEYEASFLSDCNANKWYAESDEDQCPTLIPALKRNRGFYKISPWSETHDCIAIIGVGNKQTYDRILRMLKGVEWEYYLKCDFNEAIILYKVEDRGKVVVGMDMKRKKRFDCDERLKKARAAAKQKEEK